jgi:hypothetical protein
MKAIKKMARFLGEVVIAIVATVVVIVGGFVVANHAWNYYLDTNCVSGFGSFSNGCTNDSQQR